MKHTKMLSLVLAVLLLSALLAGCGGGGKEADMTAFYDTLADKYDLSSLMELDADTLSAFYPGLSDIPHSVLIARMPMMTSVVSELILMECDSADDAASAAEILRARVKSQAEGGAWYPESVALWGEAKVSVHGRYVMLAAHESATDIAAQFEALFA